MSENPFQPPQSLPEKLGQFSGENGAYHHDGSGRTFVRQVTWVSILMILQGLLLLVFGLTCVFTGYVLSNADTFIPAEERGQFDSQLPPDNLAVIVMMIGGWSVLSLVLAIMFIVSAFMNLGLRGRIFGIITLLLGICSAFTIYCAPTGIALSIYGLIIYFNPAVAEAFRMRKSGMSKAEVLATFVR